MPWVCGPITRSLASRNSAQSVKLIAATMTGRAVLQGQGQSDDGAAGLTNKVSVTAEAIVRALRVAFIQQIGCYKSDGHGWTDCPCRAQIQ